MSRLYKIYLLLKKKYRKNEQWQLWCLPSKTEKERQEVIIGAILTQRTNWRNVELAIKNLKNKKICSLKAINRLSAKKLAAHIRPSGFYQNKGQCLTLLSRFIISHYGSVMKMKKAPLEKLRSELLKIKGIGPETADSILLYALDKPVFVIDEYTKRFLRKYGLSLNSKIKKSSYNDLAQFFKKSLPFNVRLWQLFHALIVIDGKEKKGRNKKCLFSL